MATPAATGTATGTFSPLPPARLLDTRTGNGGTTPAANGTVKLQVAGKGGVPASGVFAVVLNITVTHPTAAGYITAYADGGTAPTASNLNFIKGQTVPNLVVAPVGTDGKVDLLNGSLGTVDLIADVSGYFLAGTASAGAFTSLTPARLLDTRSTATGGPSPAANGTVKLQVAGKGGVPAGVSAVVLNITVTHPTAAGYITAYADGTTAPTASNLNFIKGQTVPNLVVAPVGTDGKVDLLNGSLGTVDLIADVSGYFNAGTPSAVGAFASLNPARLLDTRTGNGGTTPAANKTVKLQVAGRGNVPATGVSAVVLNITVTHPTAAGYITAYADGTTAPTASNLNFIKGQTVPNLVVAPVGTDGKVDLLNGSLGTVDLIADVSGYFLGDTSTGGTAGISGTVTAVAGGGLGAVRVTAEPIDDESGLSSTDPRLTTTTNSTGAYTLAGLAPGEYSVCFDGSNATGGADAHGYVGQCYLNNGPDPEDATPVTVTSGNTTININAALVAGGGIAGTVTATDGGGPVTGVNVAVHQFGGQSGYYGSATTSTTGAYEVKGLPAGDYTVCFLADDATGAAPIGYLGECYNNVPLDSDATPKTVSVTAGAAQNGIDAALATASGISGRVTVSGSSTVGLSGVDVEVLTRGSDDEEVNDVETGSDGTYRLTGLPAGTYDVCFDASGAAGGSSTSGYLDQCYDGVAWVANDDPPANATSVTTTTGSFSSGVDAALTAGGAISGKVTALTASGAALSGVEVDVSNSSGDFVRSTETAADGTYSLLGLNSGTYSVCFYAYDAEGGASSTGYLDQCVSNISVTVRATTGGVNAALAAAAGISGTVTGSSGGVAAASPLKNVRVTVYDTDGDDVNDTTTAADGTYLLGSLDADTYTVCFDADNAVGGASTTGYLGQCYNGTALDPENATPIVLAAGKVKTDVNAVLAVGGAVHGTVTTPLSPAGTAPLAGVDVTAYAPGDDDGDDIVADEYTAADGTYALNGLPKGTYTICFDASEATGGPSTTGYVDQCFDNIVYVTGEPPTTVKPVSVTPGSVSTADASLTVGGAISGTITGGGSTLSEVEVDVYTKAGDELALNADTSSDGTYTVSGLPTGSYTVCFDASDASGGSSTGGYVSECYQDKAYNGFAPPSGTTVVSAKSGKTHSGIDADLTAGASISGTVTAKSSGAALEDVDVRVFTADGDDVDNQSTEPDGTYEVASLPAGTYTVCFDGSSARASGKDVQVSSECYSGIAWNPDASGLPTGTTGIPLDAGQSAPGVDEALAPAAGITGTVTAAAGGAVLAGVDVEVYTHYDPDSETGGDYVGSGTTGADGTYTVAPVASSTVGYDVTFNGAGASGGPSAAGYLTAQSTTPVIVAAGTLTTLNETLGAAAGVSGTITEAGTKTAIADADVEVFDRGNDNEEVYNFDTDDFPDNPSAYEIVGLTPSSAGYIVCVSDPGTSTTDPTGHLAQCYNAKAWDGQSAPPSSSAKVAATVNVVTPGINFSLAVAGAISGKVTETDGSTAGDVSVSVLDSNGNFVGGGYVDSDGDGSYTVGGLPASGATGYTVCFDAEFADDSLASECFDNKPWNPESSSLPKNTAKVAVTVGKVTPNISAVLADA